MGGSVYAGRSPPRAAHAFWPNGGGGWVRQRRILGGVIGEDFAEVLAAAQRGNEAAFAQLWRDANPPLLRYLRVVSRGDVDDVAAETWATVVRGLTPVPRAMRPVGAPGFSPRPDAGPSTTVDAGHGTATCRSTTWRRLADLPGTTGPCADPADLVVAQDAVDQALAAIRRLPPLQAEVLMLRLVAGLPSESVARLTGSTPGAVRVAAHRGLKKLAEEMSRAGVTP